MNIKGKKIVVTGTLPNISRRTIVTMLEEAGAIVCGAVTEDTDIVIAGENPGSKLTKAKHMSVEIVDILCLFTPIHDAYMLTYTQEEAPNNYDKLHQQLYGDVDCNQAELQEAPTSKHLLPHQHQAIEYIGTTPMTVKGVDVCGDRLEVEVGEWVLSDKGGNIVDHEALGLKPPTYTPKKPIRIKIWEAAQKVFGPLFTI